MKGERLCTRRWIALAILLLPPLSCSELPTKPLRLVTVTGSVRDRDGSPAVGNFDLTFRNLERVPDRYRTRPDPHLYGHARTRFDGSYSIDLYEGTYDVIVYSLEASGYESRVEETVRIAPDRAGFDYQYTGVRVRGRIYGPGGIDLPGAEAYAEMSDGSAGSHAAIDYGNGFSMLVKPGRYDFNIGPPPQAGVANRRVRGVEVEADTTIDFHLDGFPVTGTVRGPDGQPLPNVPIEAGGSDSYCDGRTGADGSYLLYLPAGTYSWNVDPVGPLSYIASRTFPATYVTGPAQYDFKLDGVRWTSRARVLPDSTPARGYQVTASPFFNYGTVGAASTSADTSGAFQLVVPSALVYRLTISDPAPNGLRWTLQPLLAGGDSTLDFLLDPATGQRPVYYAASRSSSVSPDRPAARRLPDRIRRSWSQPVR